MPLNLLKIYNQLLELDSLNENQRTQSLKGIFNRDFVENINIKFRNKSIKPTPVNGQIEMDTLYKHLTCLLEDKIIRNRVFDIHRSRRLHWVRFHLEEQKTKNVLVFSVREPEGVRTYIYDKDEKYVIVLEPLKKQSEYYLLSAYYVRGKDAAREKFEKKYKRRLPDLL